MKKDFLEYFLGFIIGFCILASVVGIVIALVIAVNQKKIKKYTPEEFITKCRIDPECRGKILNSEQP